MLQALKGWRTLAFNGLLILAGVAAYLDAGDTALGQFMTPAHAALAAMIIGVCNVVLRMITKTPWGTK